ncbi:MAG: cation transporter [Bacteroidales bacterium]|nr:cation transporter [Bacteroidales bacterium]
MEKEKKSVAGWSVVAAVFLTGFKLIVGLFTGSLGILSEALHSGLDLVAAVITYFSVRISDKPADIKHPYGHGKVENLSALLETLLLIITCFWIIYEAVERLASGKTHIEVNIWSYIVVVTSIVVDYTRSRALYRTARKYNSQALEADALHFSTDIWSSSVVLIGLICANFGYHIADPIAALGVAAIVLVVSFKLGERAVNVLLDTSPAPAREEIAALLDDTTGILAYNDLKVRVSGADTFVNVTLKFEPSLSLEAAHRLSDTIEEQIHQRIERCNVHIHYEPASS